MEQFYCREMTITDMPSILEIEETSFEYPWGNKEFGRVFKTNYKTPKLQIKRIFGITAECKEEISGYVVYEVFRRKLQILNIAVHPKFRKLGCCTSLVNHLKSLIESYQYCKTITMEVRETNLDAQLAFRKLGFKATSILKCFFEEQEEDAYLMQYKENKMVAV